MVRFFRSLRQRLLAENRVSRYLLYAIGEIVLVVIGILIALQINTWNEARLAAQQESLYLGRLLSENQQDLASFTRSAQALEKGLESIKNLSEAFKNKDLPDSILIGSMNAYLRYGSLFPSFSPSSSTFDDLSSTGNLAVISNMALRDSIVAHYVKHKQVAERIQIDIEWGLPLDSPFTYENNIMRFEPATAALFPETPDKALAAELRRNEAAYLNNAAVHYWINQDCLAYLQKLIGDTADLIESLEQELYRS